MHKTQMNERENHFGLYDIFMSGIERAKKYDLQAEYIEWLFRELGVNKDRLTEATNVALGEWDL
jgi:aromatic ring-cleaving dioxygenase